MSIFLYLISVFIGGISFMVFGTAETIMQQVLSAIGALAACVFFAAGAVVGKLEEIREGDERHRVRSWNLGIAIIDQLRHPSIPQTSPTPADDKFREPIKDSSSSEVPAGS